MAAFKFRAQIALDLRRRRDDDAQRALAAANTAVMAADAALHAAVLVHDAALAASRAAQQQPAEVATLMWHRNWIIARQRETDRRRQLLDERRADAERARQTAARTHMDVRVLEKFKERAWRTYTIEVQRAEQKDIDWLAVLKAGAQSAAVKEHE